MGWVTRARRGVARGHDIHHLVPSCVHVQCRVYFFHHIKRYLLLRELITFPIQEQCCCACQGEESSTIFSCNVFDFIFFFEVIFIFEVTFIFDVVFTFEVIFIFDVVYILEVIFIFEVIFTFEVIFIFAVLLIFGGAGGNMFSAVCALSIYSRLCMKMSSFLFVCAWAMPRTPYLLC